MGNDPVVVLKNVSKQFGNKSVLKSIDGTIERGRVIGLLGENGAGKTTLFRILLDAITPDAGEVRVLGHKPDGTGTFRQRIGYIPERPAFHSFMTVGQVLKFRAGIYQYWDHALASEYQQDLKLDTETKISAASKGTLAKLAWICATAHRPALLLLDEPTSGLDILVRESVLNGLVRELGDQGETILVANHRMEEMANLIHEIWILAKGTIVRKVMMDDLRSSARRITGRLKKEVPKELRIVEEHRTGPVVSWVAVDQETLSAIRDLALLEQMEVLAVPPEVSLKALMKREETQ